MSVEESNEFYTQLISVGKDNFEVVANRIAAAIGDSDASKFILEELKTKHNAKLLSNLDLEKLESTLHP